MRKSQISIFYEYLNLLNNPIYTKTFLDEVVKFPEQVKKLLAQQNENLVYQISLLHVKTEIANLFFKKEFSNLWLDDIFIKVIPGAIVVDSTKNPTSPFVPLLDGVLINRRDFIRKKAPRGCRQFYEIVWDSALDEAMMEWRDTDVRKLTFAQFKFIWDRVNHLCSLNQIISSNTAILKYLKSNLHTGGIDEKMMSHELIETFIKKINSIQFSTRESEFYTQVKNFLKDKNYFEIKTDTQDKNELTQSSDLAENRKLLEVFHTIGSMPFHLTVTTANVDLKLNNSLGSEEDFRLLFLELKKILKFFKFTSNLKIHQVRIGRNTLEKENLTTKTLVSLISGKENVRIIFKIKEVTEIKKKTPEQHDQSFFKKLTKKIKNVISVKNK